MKRSPFSIASLVAGIMIVIPVALILIIDSLGLGESHPLVVVAFPLILLFSLAEAPIQAFNVPVNIPVVMPLIAVGCAIAGIQRREPKKNLAIAGIALAAIGVGVILAL